MPAPALSDASLEPSAGDAPWRFLSRDPVLRGAVIVGVLSLTVCLLPILPPAAVEHWARYYSDIPEILLVALAFQLGLHRLESRTERRFWNVLTVGLGCWLFVKLLDLVVPLSLTPHPYLQIVRAASFTGLYLALVVGLELKPHAADTPRAPRLARLEAKGAVTLAFGLFVYFALIPVVLTEQIYRTAVPPMVVYLMLDIYLLLRLAVLLADPTLEGGWRQSYGCLLLAALCWVTTDGAETLRWAELLDPGVLRRILDVLWLPPFLMLVAAARLRHGPAGSPGARGPLASGAKSSRWRGSLIFQAGALPVLHLVLSKAGAVDVETAGAREAWAILTTVVILWLAVVHQRCMEEENERLVAARLGAAEAASLTKSRFLATMSHELRTPLNGVLGATDLLLRSGLDESQRRLGEILRLSAQSLLEMVSDVLDFSRIEADRLVLETVELDPRRMLTEVAALLGTQAGAKALEVACGVDPGTPARVLGDPTRLRQILVNLVGNAIKFTARGRIELHLRRGEGVADRMTLRFEVRDTGIGIAPAVGARIFEVFSQADDSTARHFGGSGLGLAISRKLARLMGGDLDYESEVGVGTVFRLTVPFAPAPGLDPAAPPPSRADADPEPPAMGMIETRGCVLVVDDNAVNLEIARAMLSSLGCDVQVAAGGAEALAALRLHRYDAVFMDCMMPGMDGYEVTKALRSLEASRPGAERTPVIALTASATTEDRDRCFAADMDDYLSKPFRREALDGLLGRWLAPPAVASEPCPETPSLLVESR